MEEKRKEENTVEISLEMFGDSIVQAEGEAASQILQAYKGVRYDSAGRDLNHQGRSLKGIREYHLNEDSVYAQRNIKQQSGFDAELIQEVRVNKSYIRKGYQERIRTTDGIGMTNDTQYDHVIIKKDGKAAAESGSQMKFYGTYEKRGEIAYRVIDKLATDDSWERYDGFVDIPAEQFEGARQYAQNQGENLRKQAEVLRDRGDIEQADALKQRAEQFEKASQKIRASEVTTDEAIEARLFPELFTAKEFMADANRAGFEVAAGSMIVSSAISGAINVYEYMAGDKSIEEAAVDTAKDTIKAGLVGYGTGAAGSAIKALMHSSGSEFLRRCGNTALPTAIASGILETSKSIKRYADGIISESELVEELGEKGVGMMASGYGAAVGSIAGSALGSVVPVIGNVVGGMAGAFVGSIVGCAVSGTLYEGALISLKSAELSEKRRRTIEAMTEMAVNANNRYIKELNDYLCMLQEDFQLETLQILDTMQRCIVTADVDEYAEMISKFGKKFNLKLEYETFDEFNQSMFLDTAIIF